VILVTKEAHCLGDLLMKANYGGLDVEMPPLSATTNAAYAGRTF
jgi:formyltetrahydrofolate hydrolase